MLVQICNDTLQYPEELGLLRDANGLLGEPEALRARLEEDGYLLLRGFHPRRRVLAARERIRAEMAQRGITRGQHQEMKPIAGTPEVLAVLEAPALFELFGGLFGEPARTFDEKWLRAVGTGQATGIHYDNVYMGRGSERLLTVWTPFDDVPMELGTLAICVGSHREGFSRLQATYGQLDVDRDQIGGTGWFSESPREVLAQFGGQWQTAPFQAGDIMIITMLTLHASTTNVTARLRLSCDTRFQPAGDRADERWVGPERTGHPVFGQPGARRTVEEARKEWGV